MKYYLITNGCPVNKVDSTLLENQLRKLGYEATNQINEADLCLVNGCHANNQNINESLKLVQNINQQKRPNAILGVVGCLAAGQKERLLHLCPDISFYLGPFSSHKLKEVLDEHLQTVEEKLTAEEKAQLYKENKLLTISDHNKNMTIINVHEGCNNFCTYCIVPYIRDREFSKPLDDVLNEAKLSTTPIIDLAGQNVSNYAYDLETLLNELVKLDNIKGISCVNSLHPNKISFKILDLFINHPKIIPHLEFGLQSGSNHILKLMNRKHTVEDFLRLYNYIQDSNLTFGADIIVGFPGETEEDFQETVKLLRYSKMFNINVFTYYKVKGTVAAIMENQIPETIKNSRKQILLEICQENFIEYIDTAINSVYRGCILENYDQEQKIGYYELPFKRPIMVKIDQNNAPVLAKIRVLNYNQERKIFNGEIIHE